MKVILPTLRYFLYFTDSSFRYSSVLVNSDPWNMDVNQIESRLQKKLRQLWLYISGLPLDMNPVIEICKNTN